MCFHLWFLRGLDPLAHQHTHTHTHSLTHPIPAWTRWTHYTSIKAITSIYHASSCLLRLGSALLVCPPFALPRHRLLWTANLHTVPFIRLAPTHKTKHHWPVLLKALWEHNVIANDCIWMGTLWSILYSAQAFAYFFVGRADVHSAR